MMRTTGRLASLFFLFGVCLFGVGCSDSDIPDLAAVHGVVTMDNVPLAGVNVIFQPEEGRAAVAETDAEGKYELSYTSDNMGAISGPAEVMIMWPDGVEATVGIPAKYNSETEFKREVKDGDNEFNFDLESS